MYNKDEVKQVITPEQMFELLVELGGEPIQKEGYIVSRTICHNCPGEGSYKLYFYTNSNLFKCYTECEEEGAFDVFQLIAKVKKLNDNEDWSLYRCVAYIASYFGIVEYDYEFGDNKETLSDWSVLNHYEKNEDLDHKKLTELKVYDDKILRYLPKPRILPWEEEGIKREIMESRGISYDPINNSIIIPHYDENKNLVGIRQRTLIKELEKYGKYTPARLNGVMYNHPLSFTLYNLNNSKEAIKIAKTAIIFESEKSCMLYAGYFGIDNDISIAVCGSSLTVYQVQLLLSLGVQEMIIAFDKQFEEIGDNNFQRWTKKLTNIHQKYHAYCTISFIFDKIDMLGFKDSPIDRGPEIFLELFKQRVYL